VNTKRFAAVTLGLGFCVAGYLSPASATPLLGDTASTFAVLGGGGVTVGGGDATTITGNVGSSPTDSVTGFPPGVISGGIHTSTTVAAQAQSDALKAYNFLGLQTPKQTLTGDLGGRTLTPGVYQYGSSAELTGTLTLDANHSDNAVFIFDIGSTLTTASSAMVSLINGGPNDGIFWLVGSSATLGDSTQFVGNILANSSITFDPFSQLTCGRALAGIIATSGVVTMANGNHVAINAGSDCVSGYGGGYEANANAEGGFVRLSDSTPPPTGTPAPASLALLAIGLAAIGAVYRRKGGLTQQVQPEHRHRISSCNVRLAEQLS
jgi:hypothetical protein